METVAEGLESLGLLESPLNPLDCNGKGMSIVLSDHETESASDTLVSSRLYFVIPGFSKCRFRSIEFLTS